MLSLKAFLSLIPGLNSGGGSESSMLVYLIVRHHLCLRLLLKQLPLSLASFHVCTEYSLLEVQLLTSCLFPGAVGRIMGLLRNGSEGVAAEAVGLVAVLIGGGPGDSNILSDARGERHATIMHTKSVRFANNGYVIILANRLKPMSVSPLLSMAIVEILEAMICEPHSETTQYPVFVELLRQVAGLRRRLFALFGHPAESATV
ncbi:hypothetical protein MLD38_014800 [Melastoma candidum]|uniref:Uncharacterized protein n=1 Tax=Melastoma candidum TaxID=119954 RepID=A0ACB9RD96_9MYRT|nr:hypothetical protein MLD38_014800 [Melastoma candidum]